MPSMAATHSAALARPLRCSARPCNTVASSAVQPLAVAAERGDVLGGKRDHELLLVVVGVRGAGAHRGLLPRVNRSAVDDGPALAGPVAEEASPGDAAARHNVKRASPAWS